MRKSHFPTTGIERARAGQHFGSVTYTSVFLAPAVLIMRNPDLFGSEGPQADQSKMPEGFLYATDFVTPAEESELVAQIARLDLKSFEFHGHQGRRRVHSFGYRYDYDLARGETASPIPDFLEPLRRKVAGLLGLDPAEIRQLLVTEYAPGAPIGWHKDTPEFEIVAGVSLLSACIFRLRRRQSDRRWDRRSLRLEPRSAYVMSGEARQAWEHSIPPLEELRYSLTFRTLARGTGAASQGRSAQLVRS